MSCNLLLIKSANDRVFSACLKTCGDKWPEKSVAVLAHREVIEACRRGGLYHDIPFIPFKGSRMFGFHRQGLGLLSTLRKIGPATVVLPYNETEDGYFHWHLLLLLSRSPDCHYFSPSESLQPLSRRTLSQLVKWRAKVFLVNRLIVVVCQPFNRFVLWFLRRHSRRF